MKKQSSTHHAFPVFGLFFGFVGSALLGFLIGFFYLFSIKPTPISTSNPVPTGGGETDPTLVTFNNQVYYYRSSGFRQNAQALVKKLYASNTNQIEISALELNAWAAANLSTGNNYSSGDEGNTPSISITPETPVFQIAENLLHVAYPLGIEAWGRRWDLTVISSGDFKSTTAGPDWNPQRLYINSAPIPFRNTVYELSKPKVLGAVAKNAEAEKLVTAWKMIKSIKVGDATLTVIRK